jgi:cell division transport system permease protein
LRVRSIRLIASQTLRGLMRNFAFMALVIVAACMFVLGSTFAVALNVTNVGIQMQKQIEVKAFLVDGFKNTAALADSIKAIPGVKAVIYVSGEDALKNMAEDYPDYREVIASLPENPLPASFDVKLSDPKSVKEIAGAVESFDGVESVNYGTLVLYRANSRGYGVWQRDYREQYHRHHSHSKESGN